MIYISHPSIQTRNEAQRSERFGTPLWRLIISLVDRKRGSISRFARATLGWNDECFVIAKVEGKLK